MQVDLGVAQRHLGVAGTGLRLARMSLGVAGTMLGATGRSLGEPERSGLSGQISTRAKCSVAAGSPRDGSVRLGGRVACIPIVYLAADTRLRTGCGVARGCLYS